MSEINSVIREDSQVDSSIPVGTVVKTKRIEETADPVLSQILRALFLIGGLIGACVVATVIETNGGSRGVAQNVAVSIAITTTLIYWMVLSPGSKRVK